MFPKVKALKYAICLLLLCSATLMAAQPVFLYARHFNAEGEKRYVPDKDYSQVLERLGETFEVRVNRDEPTLMNLLDVDVILISNPSQSAVSGHPAPPGFSAAMVGRLVDFVRNGGGIIIMGNQENHNLELESTNQLLAHFGMGFEETFTDIKALAIPDNVPMVGGLRWGYYSGNLVTIDAGHVASPVTVIENDSTQPLLKGTRDAKGALLASATLGKGRVIVVTDAGWITNTVLSGPGIANVKIPDHHNFEIFRRLSLWASEGSWKPNTEASNVFQSAPELLLKETAGEGPAWNDEIGLLTSHRGNIYQRKDGKSTIYRKDARTNGLLFDAKGVLHCCEPGRKRVTRMEKGTIPSIVTDAYEGKPYNTPNDLTIDRSGRIFFSDPCYGPRDGLEQLDAKGQAIEGVYRIDSDGSVDRIISHEVDRPNGVLISNDQKWFFVADNNNNNVGGARCLYRFAYDAETGMIDLDSRKKLFDWGSGRGPDGMVQSDTGILYVAAGRTRPNLPAESASVFPGGIYAFDAEGVWLGFAPVPADEVTNCTIGGPKRDTLFITAGGELWKISLPQN